MKHVTVLLALVLAAGTIAQTQAPPPAAAVRVMAGVQGMSADTSTAAATAQLRSWDQRVVDMTRDGDLRRVASEIDTMVPGRVAERFEQRHRGVKVFGGDVTRQLNGFGQAESIMGTLYQDIAIDVAPALSAEDASARLTGAMKPRGASGNGVELMVLPTDDGRYRLAWTARVFSPGDARVRRVFLDANTGAPLLSYDDTWTQTASIGTGTGVIGDSKKMMTSQQSGRFLAVDLMRPPDTRTYGSFPKASVLTFDLKGNLNYALQVLNTANPAVSDIASDDDNTWTDAGLIDAHTYAGLTYDFYYKRFGRKGLDNNNLEIWTFTNPVRAQDYTLYFNNYSSLFVNAAYMGSGNIYYGVGLPSTVTLGGRRHFPYSGALDVVGHELTHGVTDFTSHLIYRNESGALNEAFSDMMGAAIEFYFQPQGPGLGQADWLLGEDIIRNGGNRSLSSPITFGDPDHYSLRYTGTDDNGGVHINSSIVNHMFYLAIMGGTHRVSQQVVTGVGFDNRAQIENVIFRAFTTMLPASATFSVARAATIQAARDLYGTNSAAERALTQAWSAVGVS